MLLNSLNQIPSVALHNKHPSFSEAQNYFLSMSAIPLHPAESQNLNPHVSPSSWSGQDTTTLLEQGSTVPFRNSRKEQE